MRPLVSGCGLPLINGCGILYYPSTDAPLEQQKWNHAHITCMTSTNQLLLLGTSVGLLVAIPLPLATGFPPGSQVLLRGHTGSVYTLLAVHLGDKTLLISGGKGVEEMTSAQTTPLDNCCLLIWKFS